MTASPTRRTALLMLAAGALLLAGCGRRGGLELPGETPSPIGGPTPPNLPARTGTAAEPRRSYDENRPVGRGQIVPSGRFILDPLL